MAVLTITRAKSRTREGKWFTFTVQAIIVQQGDVYLIPTETHRAKAGEVRYAPKPIPICDCKIIDSM